MGDIYTKIGKLDLALEEFQRALEFEPTAYSHHDIWVAYMSSHRLELAIEHFKRAVDLDPEFAQGFYRLAQAEEREGVFDKALAHYQRFIALARDRYPPLVAVAKIES